MVRINKIYNIILSDISYGGHSGSKSGIIIDGERWFLKYPKSTKCIDNPKGSYNTSPLEVILDYNMIKNDYDEKIEEELDRLSSSSKHGHNDINEIELIMENNIYFKNNEELKTRFWDMFITDALISNNDRNEANWGLILDKETRNIRLCPVFDNGASFYNKTNSDKFTEYLNDEIKFKQVVYDSTLSIFDEDGKTINPLKYIESMKNNNCNNALLRIFPRINLVKIKEIIDDIPEEYQELPVITKEQKEFYYKSLMYRYNNVLKEIYEKLVK